MQTHPQRPVSLHACLPERPPWTGREPCTPSVQCPTSLQPLPIHQGRPPYLSILSDQPSLHAFQTERLTGLPQYEESPVLHMCYFQLIFKYNFFSILRRKGRSSSDERWQQNLFISEHNFIIAIIKIVSLVSKLLSIVEVALGTARG